jgi:hypothetical protein
MTIYEFGASASSPRRNFSGAEPSDSSSSLGGSMMASPTEFHASIADVTDEQHQNMAGLVQPDDFNAEVVVRFLRENGIDACVDESTGGFVTCSPMLRVSRMCASRASVCVLP